MASTNWPTTHAHVVSNVHPNFRALWLNHTRQLRRMIREGRQVFDARRALKAAQRSMADARGELARASS